MKKTFQLSVIAVALMASNAYAAPVWEGPAGTGTGNQSIDGKTNLAAVDSTANAIVVGQGNDASLTGTSIGYENGYGPKLGDKAFSAGTLNNISPTGDSSIGIGRNTKSQGDNSVAVGANVYIDKASSIAMGNSVHVYGENSASIGGHSEVVGDQAASFGDWAWTGGDSGATAIGSQTWANAKNATTLGYNAETGSEGALNIGGEAHGDGLNSIHIGYNTLGAAENTIVLGSSGTTRGWADDKNSVAIGYGADTDGEGKGEENTVSFGGFWGGTVRKVTQVANGVNDQDAINVSQLNDAIAGLTSGAELIAHADTLLSTEKTERIAGDAALQTNIDAEKAARIAAVNTEKTERIAGDAALQTNIDAEKAARILVVNTEKTERIAGDAVLQTNIDAEKAARILAVNTEKADRIAGDAAEKAARADADLALNHRIDVEAATRASEVNRLDGRIDQASRRLDDIEKSAYRGVAIALAAQQAVPNIRSGQIALFAGVGHYEGETAGSVGVVTSFIANRVSLSGAVGFAGGNEVGGRIGLSYSF